MSSPLCPPRALPTDTRKNFKPDPDRGSVLYENLAVVSIPPAQPIKSSPSSSESRLISTFPVMKPGFRALAPSSPVSSDTVKSASMRPVRRSEVRTASCAAIPIPQSAPKVVSLAIIHPFSISHFMGSLAKSCSTPAFFSHTMSEWLWSTITGTFSLPGEAGFTITTLPAASVLHSSECLAAKSCSQATIFSSCPDSRGTLVMSLNMDRTSSDVIFHDFVVQFICGKAQASCRCP